MDPKQQIAAIRRQQGEILRKALRVPEEPAPAPVTLAPTPATKPTPLSRPDAHERALAAENALLAAGSARLASVRRDRAAEHFRVPEGVRELHIHLEPAIEVKPADVKIDVVE